MLSTNGFNASSEKNEIVKSEKFALLQSSYKRKLAGFSFVSNFVIEFGENIKIKFQCWKRRLQS